MKRPPPVHEFQPPHTEGTLLGPPPARLGLGRYKRIWQLLICGTIILSVMTLFTFSFYKARGPALEADCLGRERMLGSALEQYRTDHDLRLPLAPTWRWAISNYVDMVGGETEGIESVRRTTGLPRGYSSCMRCLANETTIPISYFYLDPREMAGNPNLEDAVELPLLVDEVHHRRVMILRNDYSCRPVDRQAWITERENTLHIKRRPDWQYTFAYQSARLEPSPSSNVVAQSARLSER
ncbi:MAG: hypothetical protein ACUVX8_04420 [Candidatus Zipacnadales bacterium]